MAIDTACSSSMVAVDLACRNIDDGSCDMAIAAGCMLLASPATFIVFANSNMLSPTGRISTFDAGANGYVRGEGFGAVVLKPLSKALADGDEVYALIRATLVNQDGRTPTLTSPSQEAQMSMLQRLCDNAAVDPADVGYVECHGTGTPTGDPIEAGAVGRVFAKSRRRKPLLIGSVKPNVGHLESAAGITGLIKGAMIARHGLVPPNINFDRPNPKIAFDALNIEVPCEVRELPSHGRGQMVVVNSFGFGGTNACAMLEAFKPARLPVQAKQGLRAVQPNTAMALAA
jgi:acyl transferase domain-containing protein